MKLFNRKRKDLAKNTEMELSVSFLNKRLDEALGREMEYISKEFDYKEEIGRLTQENIELKTRLMLLKENVNSVSVVNDDKEATEYGVETIIADLQTKERLEKENAELKATLKKTVGGYSHTLFLLSKLRKQGKLQHSVCGWWF